jgi:hypothetical protein
VAGEAFWRLLVGRYDRWPDETDYQSEVDQLVEVCKEYGSVSSVLDLEHGTGRHSSLLAATGYDTAGGGAPGRAFDAVIAMGPTVGGAVSDEALSSIMDNASGQLETSGLFLFVMLDGNAVLRHEPRSGFGRIDDGDGEVVRAVRASVDPAQSVLGMDVRLWRLRDGRVVDRIEETWSVRFFLPRELELVLSIGGFVLTGTAPLAGATDPAARMHRLVWARKR